MARKKTARKSVSKKPAQVRTPSKPGPPTPPEDPLTESERAFLLEYEANGHNGTRAYMELHPRCQPSVIVDMI